jgi:hypothetical protein
MHTQIYCNMKSGFTTGVSNRAETAYHPGYMSSPTDINGVDVARSLAYCGMLCRLIVCPFVLVLLVIALYVLYLRLLNTLWVSSNAWILYMDISSFPSPVFILRNK